MTAIETAAALQRASDGLTYQSESDAPWVPFCWPTAQGEPTADAVRKRGRHRAGSATEERGIDEFFAPLIEDQDWYGDEEKAVSARYRALLAAVKGQLIEPKVVRVGDRRVTVYLVGRAGETGWAGLKTTAVET